MVISTIISLTVRCFNNAERLSGESENWKLAAFRFEKNTRCCKIRTEKFKKRMKLKSWNAKRNETRFCTFSFFWRIEPSKAHQLRLDRSRLREFADEDSIFIYQPNGESFQYSKNRNIFQSQNDQIEIYSGTIIYVPRKVNDEYIRRLRTQAYASILSGLAVSLASVSVLGD